MIIKKLPPPSLAGRGSFQNSIRYALAGEHKIKSKRLIEMPTGGEMRGEIIASHGILGIETAAVEMDAQAALSSRCKDPVGHFVISYHPDEFPSDEEQQSHIAETLEARGMKHCQFVAIRHRDTRHQHIHIITNRVLKNGKAVSLSRDFQKLSETQARIAARQGWKLIATRENVNAIATLKTANPSLETRSRDGIATKFEQNGDVKFEALIRDAVAEITNRCDNWRQFHAAMAAAGLRVQRTEKIGKGRQAGQIFFGIRIIGSDGQICKGSDVGCKYATLAERFGAWESAPDNFKIATVDFHDPDAKIALPAAVEISQPRRGRGGFAPSENARPDVSALNLSRQYREYKSDIAAANADIKRDNSEAWNAIRLERERIRMIRHKHRDAEWRKKRDRYRRRWKRGVDDYILEMLGDLISDWNLKHKIAKHENKIVELKTAMKPFVKAKSFHQWRQEQQGHGPWKAPDIAMPQVPASPSPAKTPERDRQPMKRPRDAEIER